MAGAPLNIPETLRTALEHHQAGRLAEAEALYQSILAQEPRHADALHFLGMLAYQVGRCDVAIELIRHAIAEAPGNAACHSNLAAAYRGVGNLDATIASCRRALEIDPQLVEAHNNLGSALVGKGQWTEAIASLERALAIKPDYPDALTNRGAAQQALGLLDEAIDSYRRAIAIDPKFHKAHSNLGSVLKLKGRADEAIASLRRALDLRPDFAEAHNNLGNALKDKGRLDDAIAEFRRALSLNANLADAHNNLGIALKDKGRVDEGVAELHRALELQPDFAIGYNNLGNALKDKGLLDEAIACFRRALELQPGDAARHSNVVCTLQYSPRYGSEQMRAELRQWNETHAAPLPKQIQPHANSRDPGRRLKVGYVSPDLHAHPVGSFLLPILEHRDRSAFEIFCYSCGGPDDAVTGRLRGLSDHWRNLIGESDQKAAAMIRRDGIDILIDLALHTANNRLLVFARKPAPVQITYMGYPNSTGMTAIDYRLTDPYLDPPGLYDADYSEESVRLRDTFWCYDPGCTEPAVNELPALSAGHITFGSLNNFCKINEPVLRIWSGALRAVKDSHMVILSPEGDHRARVLAQFQREGVEPARIEWFNRASRSHYLAGYHRIDIGLDTLPYNGHSTSLDSFWMGVPVITLESRTVVGRGGVSQLMNLGLPGLIARNPREFAGIAAGLAHDLPRLSALRRTLRRRMETSPLMDAPRFVSNLEETYRMLWQRWCRANAP